MTFTKEHPSINVGYTVVFLRYGYVVLYIFFDADFADFIRLTGFNYLLIFFRQDYRIKGIMIFRCFMYINFYFTYYELVYDYI